MTHAAEPTHAGLFSELGRATRGLVLVARRRPLAIVGAIGAVALSPSCACLVGLAFVPFLIAFALAAARRALTDQSSRFEPMHLVAVLSYGSLPLAGLLGLALASGASSPLGPAVAMTATAATGGALFGLVAGVPFQLLGGRPLVEALEVALGDTIRLGLERRAIAGAIIAVLTTAIPFVLDLLAAVAVSAGEELGLDETPWSLALLAVPLGQGIGLVWMLALGKPLDGSGGVTTLPGRYVLSRVLGLGVPVVGVVLCALAGAAARPIPGHAVPTRDERERSVDVSESVALPGEHGLVVHVRPSGVSVDAADGGGAGLVELGTWPHDRSPALRYARSDVDGWIVFATNVERPNPLFGRDVGYATETRGVRFDARGVRTDDGLFDRVRWRFGTVGLWLLVLALFLSAPFLVTVARGVGSAGLLDRGEAGGDYGAWSGSLELDEHREPCVEGGRLATPDGARLLRDGSDGVVALAPGALVLGPDGPLVAGTRVSVVARSERLATLGPRTGSVAWPEDGWLVVGSLDAAKDRIVRLSLRTAAVFGVPSALAALVACVLSLLSS